MITSRRSLLVGLGAALCARSAHADELTDKRLQNRLELWANYAKRTRNLIARVTTTRETSLLREPLVVTGQIIFRAPSTFVVRDDGLAGSTTIVDGDELSIVPNQRVEGTPLRPPIARSENLAAAWLADRLRAAFAPGDGAELIADARTDVPKRGYRLDILPPRGSVIRRAIRSVTLHLDPVAGAVTQILIAEAQGDRVHMQIADHRQNLPDEDLDALMAEIAKLRA
ncbi:MAG: outer membrane lipoprotein carrier protein LolA [Deltaproteobacteria bacterium]|nr:outer membrane lipoprotein carrier protein LolA [Deltaproteobacteria bacterium]MBK8240830.1 outer membrane lipoprotein carrier protein LolA [Deltaproteobacteria bacterium]MBK8714166.1 outer membrane lipoprotein carrier protein LolA [Deltaproteobacteria bacterium]MBP7285580.1 outer membrane lipoprotein carrier protein LolA [Nannocystaceae bacterium]